ncbi:S-layer homology domain-containing protein [Paeniglutamicibacter antarcticus]|uniref:S-layer homology domain-containing protein n=2 Tax=Arthrobacter terrae TaxID=2935737 RepID=A0A931G436_9MICC|nr:S-layer homology domain-containing protein [Arthrobacter terrae]
MGSPPHKAAMLDWRETDTGVGVVVPTSGPYQGWHLVVANLAGYPASAAPVAKPAPPVSPFSDLVAGQPFLKEMNWMASRKISTGYSAANGTKSYHPLEQVNRDAMAAFMYRLAGSPSYTPPKTSPFTDVKRGQQFYKEICWLASKKITTGYPGARGTKAYRPLQPIGRDAMAAFMYRLSGSPSYMPPRTSPFADVKSTQQYYKEISWLAAKGISTGWDEAHGRKNYRSLQQINRDAMAAFMYRWAN